MWRYHRLPSVVAKLQQCHGSKSVPLFQKNDPVFTSSLVRTLKSDHRSEQAENLAVKTKPAGTSEVLRRSEDLYRVGQNIEGFVVQEVGEIPEFALTAVRLTHERTKAKYLHIDRNDSNNVFSIGFRTIPMDSSGVPHILEHITLCGSEKYPVRDPFFKMLNRSLSTFMNAFTAPDSTFYPFSTQNRQDYNNLMSVYLDAVFRPQLRSLDFLQEGWRLEHENPKDKNTPIVLKGVVFNEMKGVFAENPSIFYERLLNSLLPSHTYGVISGGYPKDIPSLSHDALKAFHRKFYQPANAHIYSYGTFPLQEHLSYLNKTYLHQFPSSGLPDIAPVPREPKWTAERREHHLFRPDNLASDPNKQSTIAVASVLADSNDIQEIFELQLISELLVKGPNSPFYKSLVEPNIGSGLAPATGLTTFTRDAFFSVGLQGIDAKDFDRVVNIVDETLKNVVEKGFEKELVEGVLHNMELSMRHQSADFGLRVMMALMSLWTHDGDVITALREEQQVHTLRQRMKDNPRYLQDKVNQYLQNNSHRLVVSMSPDEEYEKKRAEEEAAVLAQKLSGITEKGKEKIYEQGLELLKHQESKDDISILPTLGMKDIKPDVERYHLEHTILNGVPVQWSPQPTNGIAYFRGVINTSHLSNDQKALFSLFCGVAARMGTQKHDFQSFDKIADLCSGGLSTSAHLAEHLSESNVFEESLLFSTYCLERNLAPALDLFSELFNFATFEDTNRFETLVKNWAASLKNGIASSGHSYAALAAGSLINPSKQLKETTNGLTSITSMTELAKQSDMRPMLAKLREISALVFSKDNLRLAVNATEESLPGMRSVVENFVDSLPGSPKTANPNDVIWTRAEAPASVGQPGIHHIFPFPGNYAAKCVRTVRYMHPDYCNLLVLAKLLSSKYLLPNVREKGGAYGVSAGQSGDGLFSFSSYRDPNSTATLDVFDGSCEWVTKGAFTDQDIEESKLGIFKTIDAPSPPGSRGNLYFLDRVTYDMIQNMRLGVKGVSKSDIIRVAQTYLHPDRDEVCSRALVGPENKDLEKRTKETWKFVSHS